MIPRLLALLALILFSQPVAAAPLQRDQLVVETAAGGRHQFQVELALTPEQQARGLMFRESLADDQGMLFIYDVPQRLGFWMKNTLIPLDIIFIGPDGRIVNIVQGKPHDLTSLYSTGPATGVLEINAGLSAKLGIRAGDLVRHPAFGQRREK